MKMVWLVLGLGAVSFLVSWGAPLAMKRGAPRLGFVDKPGHRKIPRAPSPLGGGVAIFLGFALPILVVITACNVVTFPEGDPLAPYAGGVVRQTSQALAVLGAMAALHLMGL